MSFAREGDELHRQVAAFRAWSLAQEFPGWSHGREHPLPEADRGGSWECDYEEWSSFHESVRTFFDHVPPSEWSVEDADALLYAIARDSEIEHLAAEASRRPDALKVLARASLDRPSDWNARWQLADRLPKIAPDAEIEPLLVRFMGDHHECVRRSALDALARLGSSQTEALALAAWNEDHDAQTWTRMNVLDTLARIGSPHLEAHLREAAADPRPLLADFARRLQLSSQPTELRISDPKDAPIRALAAFRERMKKARAPSLADCTVLDPDEARRRAETIFPIDERGIGGPNGRQPEGYWFKLAGKPSRARGWLTSSKGHVGDDRSATLLALVNFWEPDTTTPMATRRAWLAFALPWSRGRRAIAAVFDDRDFPLALVSDDGTLGLAVSTYVGYLPYDLDDGETVYQVARWRPLGS